MKKADPVDKEKKTLQWKGYYWWFIAGFIVLVMAVVEARVKIFYVFGVILMVIGLATWIYDEVSEAKKNVDRQGRKPKHR